MGTEINKSKTYFQKRNDFSEAHYQLPNNFGMFDIDIFKGEWLNLYTESTKDEAVYVEYRCLHFDNNNNRLNLDRFKSIAIFDLKYKGSKILKEEMLLKPGRPLWASFMFAKLIKIRFFLVVATKGKQPFYFMEYDMNGKYKHIGTLKYNLKIKHKFMNNNQFTIFVKN